MNNDATIVDFRLTCVEIVGFFVDSVESLEGIDLAVKIGDGSLLNITLCSMYVQRWLRNLGATSGVHLLSWKLRYVLHRGKDTSQQVV